MEVQVARRRGCGCGEGSAWEGPAVGVWLDDEGEEECGPSAEKKGQPDRQKLRTVGRGWIAMIAMRTVREGVRGARGCERCERVEEGVVTQLTTPSDRY